MSNELQPIEEIEKIYPNEWVLIVDCETDEATTSVIRGRVVAHGRKREIYEKVVNYTGKVSIRYTGKLPEDVGVMF
jgi:hypothetical protein|uniref:DUF5678 domain-containing protein n=1 Tax=candidate division WOR-3 bacterium TaxID=2052148 RepID=A0A7C6A7V9_UNCW3